MRGLGKVLLVLGVVVIVFALSMDVSISTGVGRVNNIGLMAERQNYTVLGGIMLIAGLLAIIFGSRGRSLETPTTDARPCPFCAEPIKLAAIKCKHCGSSVDQASEPLLKEGWVASIPCAGGDDSRRAQEAILSIGYRAVPMAGVDMAAGPFKTKEEAKLASDRLSEECKFFSSVTYRDSVTGDYPPL